MNANDYGTYLQTPQWKATRNRALKQAGFKCGRCQNRRHLQVHHTTYERLGRELDSDLQVLCEDCHRSHHERELHDVPETRLYLRIASQLLRDNPVALVSDIVASVKEECIRLHIPRNVYAIDKAVNVLIGSNRFKPATPPPQTLEDLYQVQGRPLTHAEVKDYLRRWGLDGLMKPMPASPVAKIDIYGDPPAEDFSYEVF